MSAPADTDQPTLAVTTTGRGFAVARGVDLYGQPWSIQDSSLATQAAIWLGGDDTARAHLTQEQAADLLPLLQRFVDTGTIAPQQDTRTTHEPRPAGDLREALQVADNEATECAAAVEDLKGDDCAQSVAAGGYMAAQRIARAIQALPTYPQAVSADDGKAVSELVAILDASVREEGCTVFDHTAEEIGMHVMDNHAAIRAALATHSPAPMADGSSETIDGFETGNTVASNRPAPMAGEGWQDIATAPKDGTPFIATLVVHNLSGQKWWETHVIWADDETGEVASECEAGWSRVDDYSHWMPLPAPPAAAHPSTQEG